MKIVLVDDHQIVRDGLRALLEREPGMIVVGEASNGRAAREVVAERRPDVVVMDVSMPELNGLEAARQISTEHPNVKIIALSMHADHRSVLAMLSAGASGYVVKMTAGAELVRAIQAVTAGHTYVSPEVATLIVGALRKHSAPPGAPAGELSTREREVLQLLAEGRTSKEIASRLGVAVSTIDTHRRQVMDKLDLRTIAELTKYAIREGLTSVER